MDFIDLILLPVFVILFSLYFRKVRNRFHDPVLKKYHRQAFWAKITGSIFFVIFYGILTGGDSYDLYHTEGRNLYELILSDAQHIEYLFKPGSQFDLRLVKNPFNAGYFAGEANFMIIRLDAIFCFLTFGRYAPVNIIFGMIAFSGLWKLFLFFCEQHPHLHKKFAIAILFFPTLVFWSSGLLKDTLCIASLGWITYALFETFYHKKNIFRNILILLLFAYLLAVLKVYILLAYVPFFALFIIFKNVQGVRSVFLRWVLTPALIFASIFVFTKAMSSFDNELGAYSIDEVTSSISTLNAGLAQKNGHSDAASNFELGAEFDGSFFGLLKIAPYAIVATFFRPFIWEAGKVTQMLAAVESLIMIFFTLLVLFKTGPFRFLKIILTDPLIMYCFLFAIVFGLFVGASTINFGTLVRYKIPCLPFFAISLFLVHERGKAWALSRQAAASTQAAPANVQLAHA